MMSLATSVQLQHDSVSISAVHSGTLTNVEMLNSRVNLLLIYCSLLALSTNATVVLSVYLLIGFLILFFRSSLLLSMFVFDTELCKLLAGTAIFVLCAVRIKAFCVAFAAS